MTPNRSGRRRAEPAPGWRETLRAKAIDVVLLGLPAAVFAKLWDSLAASFLGQPWRAAWFLVPTVGLAAAMWLMLRRSRPFQLNWRARVFLLLYVTAFTGAAVTNLLNWSRSLTVLGAPAPRNWLTPVWAGDWRYALLRSVPAAVPKLAIVTTRDSTGSSRELARFEMARLVKIVADAGAKGVAFDFYLDQDSQVDPLLCSAIAGAPIPVILGHSFSRIQGEIIPTRLPDGIRKCLPSSVPQGHLAGFRDADRVVRFIPLLFAADQARPALSLRIARQLSESAVETPPDGLLRFVEPAKPHLVLTYVQLNDPKEAARCRPLLVDRFVLVGEDSARELLPTPFGDRLGVYIHADAVHSLLSRSYIRTAPWWVSALTILSICYALTLLAARGLAARGLIARAALLSALLFALAAAAMFAARAWVDVVYALAALWLLIPLLLGFRRVALS